MDKKQVCKLQPGTLLEILWAQVEEAEPGKFVADASELGWPPGHWPPKVETTLGNKQPLRRVELTDAGAVYKQDFGVVEVQVYND